MKNNNTFVKGAKKGATSKTKTEAKGPVLKMDISDMQNLTDENVKRKMIRAKIEAGRLIDPSELASVVEDVTENTSSFFKSINEGLFEYICELQQEINWLNRPWYKKVIFWKKKPSCNCCETKVFRVDLN